MLRKTFKLLQTFRVDKVGITAGNVIPLTRSLTNYEKLKPADKFGTLATKTNLHSFEDEVEDEPEGDYFGKSNTIKRMKACLDAHEYDNAKELLRIMQTREKAPDHAYKLLIAYNAKLGNVTEAFRLYNDYKKRGYVVRGAIYTSLFTACGNCPRSDIALPIAYKVANHLFESKVNKPNLTNYHAMLKAFGRHGDLSAAFQLVDRLNSRNAKVTVETYNMLLEACITNRASGLRFALLVWHYMLKKQIKPDIFTFSNMAKCAQSCSLGDIELVLDLVRMIVQAGNVRGREENSQEVTSVKSQIESQYNRLTSDQETEIQPLENNLYLESFSSLEEAKFVSDQMLENESSQSLDSKNEIRPNEISPILASDQIEIIESSNNVEFCNTSRVRINEEMNLLDPNPKCGSVIDFDDLSTPENRFMLYGGLKGFFKILDHFKVKPDIKLFNILLYCIPATKEKEEELLELKEKYKLKTDVRFVNVLLKRRLSRDENCSFQDCMDAIQKFKISPNLDTLIVFAEACRTREDGKKCIELARNRKIRFSDKFLYRLLVNASRYGDLDYLSDILAVAKEEGIQLSPKSMNLMEITLHKEKPNELPKIESI